MHCLHVNPLVWMTSNIDFLDVFGCKRNSSGQISPMSWKIQKFVNGQDVFLETLQTTKIPDWTWTVWSWHDWLSVVMKWIWFRWAHLMSLIKTTKSCNSNKQTIKECVHTDLFIQSLLWLHVVEKNSSQLVKSSCFYTLVHTVFWSMYIMLST